MRVHRGRVLVAACAAMTMALTAACGSSGNGGGGGGNGTTGGTSGATATGSNPSGANQSASNSGPTAGTFGSGALSNCNTQPLTCNSGTAKPGGTITYVLEKTLVGWNENYSPSNVFEIAEVLDGIYPNVYNSMPNLKPALNTELMDSATSTTKGGKQIITYKIKPNAVWSDGTPINFDDLLYQKLTQDGTSCPGCGASTTSGYNLIEKMTSSNNGKTVTVTMKTPFADWQSMFGPLLPAHVAKQHGWSGKSTDASGLKTSFLWFDKNRPAVSGGPMIITAGNATTSVTEKPNPKWYGSTKSGLNSLTFKVITDQSQEPIALQNGEVNALYPQPNADLVNRIKGMQNTYYYVGKGLNWEHFDFNEKNQFLKDKTLRQAIFTAIDRKQILDGTIGQYIPNAQPLNNHMYVPGQPGYQDNITSTGQGSGDIDKAKQMLTQAGYKGVGSKLMTPSGQHVQFRCTYSAGNTPRQTECTLAQNTLKQLGIDVTLKTTQDLGELGTGNFDMIVYAWVGAPFVVAGAQQIWELKGGADYGYNNDPAAEKLINEAAKSTDPATIQKLMNQADKLITNDAYSLPLYQKPVMLAINKNLVNIRDNATNYGPPYNVQDWGVKAG